MPKLSKPTTSPKDQDGGQTPYDYIVVGGGSAGCVAVNRLVLDHGARVLRLEGGHKDDSILIKMPAASAKLATSDSAYLKNYRAQPQPQLGGREPPIGQATTLGGGSSVNVLAYTRGSRSDYDRWTEAAGGFPWGYDDLLPFWRRQEGNQKFDNSHHGGDGPFKVNDPARPVAASNIFVRTLQRMGFEYRADFTAGELPGVGYIQNSVDGGRRCSSADAFLHPIEKDERLTILTRAKVRRVLFEGDRAIGVEYEHGKAVKTASASNGVILTAGAFATPKILMLSGIGPREHLREMGIEVRSDLPGVGQNLQDHALVVYAAATKGEFGLYDETKGVSLARNVARWFAFRDGPLASNGSEAFAFANLDEPGAEPDCQIYVLPILWAGDGGSPTQGVTLLGGLVQPASRGSVRLRSANAADEVAIDVGWLREDADRQRALKTLKYLRAIAATEPFSRMIEEERMPGPDKRTDEELMRSIEASVISNYHPCGTCRLGKDGDPMAVLTPDLRVRGVEGLFVFDATIMPNIISANTNSTAMVIADRGVDMMMRAKR